MAQFFQYQYAATLAHHKSVPIPVKGPGCFFRLVISFGKSLHIRNPRHSQRSNSCFTSTGNHDTSSSPFYYFKCISYGIGSCGACSCCSAHRSFGSTHNGYLSCCHIGYHHGNNERTHLVGTFMKQSFMLLLQSCKSSNSASDINSNFIFI